MTKIIRNIDFRQLRLCHTKHIMSDSFHPLRVKRKQALTADITLFELQHPNGEALPAFTPGAHITVQAPNGMRRSYSLCSLPSDTQHWQIAVKRDARVHDASSNIDVCACAAATSATPTS